MPSVTTTVTELPESRVRVQAEVAPEEIERRVVKAAGALGRELRVPGFRRGKVPAPVVLRRVGREAVLDEAVREGLGAWYTDAIREAGIVPVGDPELAVGDLPAEGDPLTFSIEIGVRPPAQLGQYKELEVGRREPVVAEGRIDIELEQLRERMAKLETVDRPAQNGDFLVIDFAGTIDDKPIAAGQARDQLLELGSGRLIPGIEEQLEGASAGEQREVEVTFPSDYSAPDLRDRQARFDITVKEVKAKVLPELDDDFAADAAGFDDLAQLRDDLRRRLLEADEAAIDSEFREAALDAAVAEAQIELPAALIDARAAELWHELQHSLAHRGVSKDVYLKLVGKSEEEVVEEAKPDAERALKREAVLAAIVEAEGIEPTEEELEQAVAAAAERERTKPAKLLARLRRGGRIDTLRHDIATGKALELIADSAKAITVEQAKARKKLWTPGHEGEQGTSGQLWTPGG